MNVVIPGQDATATGKVVVAEVTWSEPATGPDTTEPAPAAPEIPAAYGGDPIPIPDWPDEHMLEAAWGLIANVTNWDSPDLTPGWRGAAEEWRDAYHRWLDRRSRPRAALIEIIERVQSHADVEAIDDSAGANIIVPNEIRINGTPLLITEDGPRIESIDCARDGKPGPVLVTMTVIARRVVIDAEAPAV